MTTVLDAREAVLERENAELRRQLDERTAELREALDQQTATAEVLQVINSSPGDLAPVFDAMLEKAIRLCNGIQGTLWILDGERIRLTASQGLSPEFVELLRDTRERQNPGENDPVQRVTRGERLVQVLDLTADRSHGPVLEAAAKFGGVRTIIVVGLFKEAIPLGAFAISRREVRPFTEKQIALLQSFAAQAVIAIENARLLTETREALEQQTATAEVLGVINSSPGNLAPVFDAMLEKAMRLCDAAFGTLFTRDGELGRLVASRNVPEAFSEYLTRNPMKLRTILGPNFRDGPVIHIEDLAAGGPYRDGIPLAVAAVDLGGIRGLLVVPLMKDDTLIGLFAIYRHDARPSTDKQIALLENFAAQAVIAMENARLITETREALEQQTATAEVLQVINSSPGDLAPVFDAILEKAHSLCDVAHGSLQLYDGVSFRAVATHGVSDAFADILRHGYRAADSPQSRGLIEGKRSVQIADCAEIDHPVFQSASELAGIRTVLFVPLRRDDALLGLISSARREVRPFTDKQIALLQNFGAQAVIAMENARLLTETREALEQQTATAEVLQVINSSPGDLAPVFDAMLEKALGLCEATYGHLVTFDGEYIHIEALTGDPRLVNHFRNIRPVRPPPESVVERFLRGEDVVHIADTADDSGSRVGGSLLQALTELGGTRSLLGVALRKDRVLLGGIVVYRQEVRPFGDQQIALLQNFAAQAVIAIENARLLTETREALEQQTATAEVLQVINASPGDLAPVFEALLERAMRLCEAAFGILWTYDGSRFDAPAVRGAPTAFVEFLDKSLQPSHHRGTGLERVLRGEDLVISGDMSGEDAYREGDPLRRAIVDLGGARSAVTISLRKDETLLGAFTVYRQEVRPYSDKQIALLQNFAAQAVIAMENARLLTETREALEQQTATAEVLRVISSSATDVQPVFDAIVERAIKLCDAEFTAVARDEDDGLLRLVAVNNLSSDEAAAFHSLFPRPPTRGFLMGRAFLECRPISVEDVLSDPEYEERTREVLQSLTKYRSFFAVPIIRENKAIGVIGCARREVRPFTPAQIELVSTFADQAVIAIENARLLGEIQQRQAELRVTFDNMADGVVMFDEEFRLAAWNRNFQELLDLPDALLAERPGYADYLRILAERGEFGTDDIEAELGRRLQDPDQELRLERTRPDGRVIEVRRNAVPGGGFVLIYSDITARKRAEAEIRAARDAAEAALRELQAAQASLLHAEKMASLGQLTAGIAHEIKNPLNFVNNFAGLSVELLDELKAAAAPAIDALDAGARAEIDETIAMLTGNLDKIAEHGRRADGIVKSMLDHSRGESGERRAVDFNNLVEEALNLAYHGARAQDQSFNITLERDFAAAIAPIELVPQDVTRVLLNLIGNGFYAATKRRREAVDGFHPMLKVATRDLGGEVEVRVRDNGVGIPPEHRDKLFQPFFTTKPTGEGTGLGLSICWDIVTQQHGGTIEVDSALGQYTEFTICLPRRPGTSGGAPGVVGVSGG